MINLLELLAAPVLVAALRQIDPVSALLPFTPLASHRVNLTLRAFDGCYTWRVQRPYAALIRDLTPDEIDDLGDPLIAQLPVPDLIPKGVLRPECRSAVIVANYLPVDWAGSREKSWVFAEDGDASVKTEVYVARIHRLEIETTAKAVAVGSAETVRVKAYDSEGNVFSSLEGLDFKWNTISEGSDSVSLALASLNEDVYRPSSVRRIMAEEGRQSDILLIKGLDSGRARLDVRIIEPGNESVPTASVWIDVVEPFAAMPSEIAAPPGADIWASVKLLREGVQASGLRHFKWHATQAPELSVEYTGYIKVSPDAVPGAQYDLKVSDARNANNSDSTMIRIEQPKKLVPYHTQLYHVLPGAETEWNSQLESAITALVDEQFHPFSKTPESSDSLLSKVSRSLSGFNTWLLEKDFLHIFTVDLQSETGSIHLPANAVVKLAVVPDTDPEILNKDIALKWTSDTGSVCVIEVTGEVGASGRLIITLESIGARKYTLKKTVKYRIVNSLQVAGLAAPRYGRGLGTNLVASTTPLVLPLDHQVKLAIQGGQGPFKVTSSNPEVCMGVAADSKLVMSTRKALGSALISVRDEFYPTNSFVFYCVAAGVSGVYLDTKSNIHKIPISDSDEVQLPVAATGKLLERAPMWACDDVKLRTPQEREVLPDEKTISNFFACSNLESAVASEYNIDRDSVNLLMHASPTPFIRTVDSIGVPFVCKYGVLKVPTVATKVGASVQLASSTPEYQSEAVGTTVEFYTPLSTWIPGAAELPPPIQKTVLVSSEDIENSLSVFVGGKIEIHVIGGPEQAPGCSNKVSVRHSPKLSIQKLTSSKHQHSQSLYIDGEPVVFEVLCLEEAPSVQVGFEMTQNCMNAPTLTVATAGYIGCSLPQTVRIVPRQPDALLVPTKVPERSFSHEQFLGDYQQIWSHSRPLPEHSIHAYCKMAHEFRSVAYDPHGRPMMGGRSWTWSWRWSSNSKSNGSELPRYDLLRLNFNEKCSQDIGEIGVALIWQGSFASGAHTALSKSAVEALRPTAKKINTAWNIGPKKKQANIMSSLEVRGQKRISLIPPSLSAPLLHATDWAYVLKATEATANAQVLVSSGAPVELLGVSSDMLSVSKLQRMSNVKKIIDLFDRGKESLNQTRELYIYFHPVKTTTGNFTITVLDHSFLGAEPIELSLSTSLLKAIDFHLQDAKTDRIVARDRYPLELERKALYRVILEGVDTQSRPFAPAVNNALDMRLTASPAWLFKMSSTSLQPLFAGKAVIEGRVDDIPGGLKSMTVSIDEPFSVSPSELVLLPGGGLNWRPFVTGGGSSSQDWMLLPPDEAIVDIVDDGQAMRSKSNVGVSEVKVVRQAKSLTGGRSDHVINATVARPDHIAVSVDGKEWSRRITKRVDHGVRIPVVVGLFTQTNKRFTPAAIDVVLKTSSKLDYACSVQWTALNPDVVALVQETDLRRYTRLVSTLDNVSNVELYGIRGGDAKVQVKVVCGNATSRRPLSMSRFSKSATITVEVTRGYTEGVPTGERLTLDDTDDALSIPVSSSVSSSCAQKQGDEILLMPDSQYTLPKWSRLICQLDNNEAVYARPLSDKLEVCDGDSTVKQITKTTATAATPSVEPTTAEAVVLTGPITATQNAVLLQTLNAHPHHKSHRFMWTLLANPQSLTVEANGLSLIGGKIIVPVVLGGSEESTVLELPLLVRALDANGAEIQRPLKFELAWVSSDPQVVSVIQASLTGDDSPLQLRINRAAPALASVTISLPNSECMDLTFAVLVSEKASEATHVDKFPSAGTGAVVSHEISSMVKWTQDNLPPWLIQFIRALVITASALTPILCVYPLMRQKGRAPEPAGPKVIEPAEVLRAKGPRDIANRRSKNAEQFFNYGMAKPLGSTSPE